MLAECCELLHLALMGEHSGARTAHSSCTANVDLSAGREAGLPDDTVVLGC